MAISHDGRHLFISMYGRIHRFAVRGHELEHEQTGPAIVIGHTGLFISSDSQYICSQGRNREVPGSPPVDQVGAYVYRTDNLNEPVLVLSNHTSVRGLIFDQHRRLIYRARGRANGIVIEVFSPKGIALSTHKFGPKNGRLISMLPDPESGYVLLRTSTSLSRIKLPETVHSEVTAGTAMKRHRQFIKKSQTFYGAQVHTLAFFGFVDILECAVWSKDGEFLYLAQKKGIIRQIAVETLEQQTVLDLGEPISWMAMSGEGLVVVLPSSQELALIHPQALEVKTQIGVQGIRSIAATHQSGFAFASAGPLEQSLVVVDLTQGAIVREYSGVDMAEQLGIAPDPQRRRPKLAFRLPTLSPDGQVLLTMGDLTIHRFDVQGSNIDHVQMAPWLATPKRIEISADSRYTCRPSTGEIFAVQDLLTPVLSLHSDKRLTAMAFDLTKRRIYGCTNAEFVTYSHEGTPRKNLKIRMREPADQLLVHPAGGQVFVLGFGSGFWVELKSSALTLDDVPEPQETLARLTPETQKYIDWTVTKFGSAPARHKFAAAAHVLSADARFLYLLLENGMLRKISLPDFNETLQIDLRKKARSMALSSRGILIALKSDSQVWLLDEATLKVLQRFEVPSVSRVVASPQSHLGFAIAGRRSESLFIIDLAEGEVARHYDVKNLVKDQIQLIKTPSGFPREPRRFLTSFAGMTISPDGQTLVCQDSRLHRIGVREGEIRYEEIGALITVNVPDKCSFSPDGRLLVVPVGRINRNTGPGHPDLGNAGGIYVYDVNNLAKPLHALPIGRTSEVTLDPNSQYLYRITSRGKLKISDMDGRELLSGRFTKRAPSSMPAITLMPDLQHLLMVGRNDLFWIDLPSLDDPKARPEPPRPLAASNQEQALPREVVPSDGYEITRAPLPADRSAREFLKINDRILVCLQTKDKAYFVSRIQIPELAIQREIEIPGYCRSLAVSAKGILLAVLDTDEIWVLDTQSLEINKRIGVANVSKVVSSPALSTAYAISNKRKMLNIVDLEAGVVVRSMHVDTVKGIPADEITSHPESSSHGNFDQIAVTADGEHLLSISNQCVHRFRLHGHDLILRESGPRLGGIKRLAISSDSREFTIAGSIKPPGRHPQFEWSSNCSYVYSIDDLSSPLRTLNNALAGSDFHFLKTSGFVLGYGAQYDIAVFDPLGLPRKRYRFDCKIGIPHAVLTPADPETLLICGSRGFAWIELEQGLTSLQEVAAHRAPNASAAYQLPGSSFVESVVWHRGGRSIVSLTADGRLREVAADSFEMLNEKDLGEKCGALGLTSEGLVVVAVDRQALWLVDPGTFEVVKRIEIAGVESIATSQALPLVYLVRSDGKMLSALDLRDGSITYRISSKEVAETTMSTAKRHDHSSPMFGKFGAVQLTPDGQYLFCADERCLHRFNIVEGRLVHDEIGPPIGKYDVALEDTITFSADSKYVAFVGKGSNNFVYGFPKSPRNPLYVFAIDDLQQPVATLESYSNPRALAMDPASQVFISDTNRDVLSMFGSSGEAARGFELNSDNGALRQLVLNTEGDKLLVLLDRLLLQTDPGIWE